MTTRRTARVLQTLGWSLLFFGALIIPSVVVVAARVAQPIGEGLGKRFSFISSFLAPAGLLLAIGGTFLAKSRELEDATEKRSLFYLDSCTAALEEARLLLADGNNDRATWIAAARALKHAQALAKQVTLDAHLRALELRRLKYRRFFSDAIRERPAAFFYGASDPTVPLDKAAAESTAATERGGLHVSSTVRRLNEASLHVIWEASLWPDNYEDPLAGAKFSDRDEAGLMLFAPGLHTYLEHTKQFHSASGQLYPRKNRAEPVERSNDAAID